MKLTPLCPSCILDDVAGAVTKLGLPDGDAQRVRALAARHVAAAAVPDAVPSTLITAVHRILKAVTGLGVPFEELRARCNEVGGAIAARVASDAARLDGAQRFRFLARWAIAGNHLDFRTVGAGYSFSVDAISAMVRGPFDEGLAVDECEEAFARWSAARNVLFIHDNVGEIALDKLLIEDGVATGKRVVSALRGGPITSDATIDDGRAVGLDGAASEVIIAGPDTLGISWEEKSAALDRAFVAADIIVSKGQANYYVLSEHLAELHAPVFFLLRTKCDPVAAKFGHSGHVNVAKLSLPEREDPR